MDKRFQVFLSSTYSDLQEERRLVMQALMEIDCIPAGMELFPAADEEQWEFIKKIIDDCDYYLLIIGGRYGSTAPDGVSYTEKEFDYAVKKGIKVIALIHGEPGKISFEKSEQNTELRENLVRFINKVQTGRLVKFWKMTQDLKGLVLSSMLKTIKSHPAIGWVRADKIATESILTEINQLRKENQELQKTISELDTSQKYSIENIADFDSTFIIHYDDGLFGSSQKEIKISWKKIFSLISPFLVEYPDDRRVKTILSQSLQKLFNIDTLLVVNIDEQDFKTITIQLRAYGLIENKYIQATNGKMGLFWYLTKKGEQLMIEDRIIQQDALNSQLELVEKRI